MRFSLLASCPACDSHVPTGLKVCPHCDAPVAGAPTHQTAATLAMGLALVVAMPSAACGDSTGSGGSGEGGTDHGGASQGGAGQGGYANYGGTTSTYGGGPSTPGEYCDDLFTCGDVENPGCAQCAVDPVVYTELDAGTCADELLACSGPGAACSGPDTYPCCELDTCVTGCDTDQSGTIDPGPELDCVCANDGAICTGASPGSCYELHADGVAARAALEGCIATTCAISCP